jgi:hypothetical protein
MSDLLDPQLTKALELDRHRLETTEIPIVSVAGTFQDEIKKWYHLPEDPHPQNHTDVVLSRAHFSMPLGVATQAWAGKMDPKKAWMVDPTNYVTANQWRKIIFTEEVGKTLARQPLLKILKDFVDKFGRGNLPILTSITPPLLHLTERVDKPILSFHIAAGNILSTQGKEIIQVVTDPHVRPEYVMNADKPNTKYCVFDERTKLEFLEVAAVHKIKVSPDKVIVTGPPIDPRIVAARQHKVAWRSGRLRLCLVTGGLGTNKYEIRQILLQMLPELRKHPLPYQLTVYAGTQKDIADMVRQLATEHHIKIGADHDQQASLRLLYHPHILEANELLIHHGFHWAHGFITKPSGDMAYDAVAAGCFLLTLKEWGVWEERVREIFEQKDIAYRADVAHIVEQLKILQSSERGQSWIEKAMNRAFGIEKLFLLGSKKIVETVLAQEK